MNSISAAGKKGPDFIGNYKMLQFSVWMMIGCINPYVVVFLLHKNVNAVTIGTILMLNSLIATIGQPLWGMMSDRVRSIRKIFLFCLSVSVILIVPLPLNRSTGLFMLLFPAFTFFFSPMSPLLDSWTIQGIRGDGNKSYGLYRLWGSVGFSVSAIVIGKLIGLTSVNAIFVIFGAAAFFNIFYCSQFPEFKGTEDGLSAKKTRNFSELKVSRLLRNYSYVTFLVLTCIMFMTVTSMYSFIPTLMRQVGGNDTLYGVAMAVSALSEVPVLFLSKHLIKKYKPIVLVLAGILVYILRLCIYSVAASPSIVIFAQSLQGLSYGLFLTGSVYYIDHLAPEELKATAQTMGTAVYFGLSGMMGNYLAGRIIESYGIYVVYRAGVLLDIVVFLLFLLSLHIGNRIRNFQMGSL